MMLLLAYSATYCLIVISTCERLTKQRHPSRLTNAVDPGRLSSIYAFNQVDSAAPSSSGLDDYAVLRETRSEFGSDNMEYDLLGMQDAAATLLRELEDIGSELSEQQALTRLQPSAEGDRLRSAAETNIAVVSLALDRITKLLGSQGTSDNYIDPMEEPKLKDFNLLLESGEQEKRKLRKRLMQLRKQWQLPPINDRIPIDIRESVTDESDIFGFRSSQIHLRRLLPESLKRVYEGDEDQSLALPPSHSGSGLLSDTGHEDFRQEQDARHPITEEAESVQEGASTTATTESQNLTTEIPQNRQVGRQSPSSPEEQPSSAQQPSIDNKDLSTDGSHSIAALLWAPLITLIFCV